MPREGGPNCRFRVALMEELGRHPKRDRVPSKLLRKKNLGVLSDGRSPDWPGWTVYHERDIASRCEANAFDSRLTSSICGDSCQQLQEGPGWVGTHPGPGLRSSAALLATYCSRAKSIRKSGHGGYGRRDIGPL